MKTDGFLNKEPKLKASMHQPTKYGKEVRGSWMRGGDRGGGESTTKGTRREGYLGGFGGVNWGVRGIKEVQLEERRMQPRLREGSRDWRGRVSGWVCWGVAGGLRAGRGRVAGGRCSESQACQPCRSPPSRPARRGFCHFFPSSTGFSHPCEPCTIGFSLKHIALLTTCPRYHVFGMTLLKT